MFITPKMLMVATAIFLTVMFLPSLMDTKSFRKSLKKLLGDETLVKIMSIVYMIIAFLFLSVSWKLKGGWHILIPIIGWLMLIKGIVWYWFPELPGKLSKKYVLKSDNQTGIVGFIQLLMAIALLYVGIYIY